MVADEDATLVQTLTRAFKRNGVDVVPLTNGTDVLQQLEAERPDLLLIDIQMSVVDGLALLSRVRRSPHWAELPVLVLSERTLADDTLKALGLGRSDCIAKPLYVLGELLQKADMSLHASRAVRRLGEETRNEERRSRAEMVDILREVTDSVGPQEVYRVLARRVARALEIPKCSVVIAGANGDGATVVVAYENPMLLNLPIQLDRYPEIREAFATKATVLIEDVGTHPLFDQVRPMWLREGSEVRTRSAIALPFQLRGQPPGVFFLRTTSEDGPLSEHNAAFAAAVIGASTASIDKAWDLEHAVADRQRYEWLASRDTLTGCLNRRALQEQLNREFERATRHHFALTALMVDVDHFKKVNDAHGHLTGDQVLRQMGESLSRDARSTDIVGRYGGEEFVIALPDTDGASAHVFAERLRSRIEAAAFGNLGDPLRITVSVGVASYPGDGIQSVDALLARADAALYCAKRAGRNRVMVATGSDGRRVESSHL